MSRESLAEVAGRFRLSWSHYVMLLRTRSEHARAIYEEETLRGGWTVRQLHLKLGEFTHADAGQMHLYLNYAREHWTMQDENPPVGLILCAKSDHAVAKYALYGLRNKVLAAEYRTALPAERVLVEEIEKTRRQIEGRQKARRR